MMELQSVTQIIASYHLLCDVFDLVGIKENLLIWK